MTIQLAPKRCEKKLGEFSESNLALKAQWSTREAWRGAEEEAIKITGNILKREIDSPMYF